MHFNFCKVEHVIKFINIHILNKLQPLTKPSDKTSFGNKSGGRTENQKKTLMAISSAMHHILHTVRHLV